MLNKNSLSLLEVLIQDQIEAERMSEIEQIKMEIQTTSNLVSSHQVTSHASREMIQGYSTPGGMQ
jgi:hypothetical protein